MQPERLPEQPPSAAANDGRAEFATGDDAEPRSGSARQQLPVGDQATRGHPLAPLSDPRKVAPEFQAHGTGQAQRRPLAGHSRIRPESGACGRRDGDFAKWPARHEWNCGSKSRAAVCGEFSMVGTDVSCDDPVLVQVVKTTRSRRGTCAPGSPFSRSARAYQRRGGCQGWARGRRPVSGASDRLGRVLRTGVCV